MSKKEMIAMLLAGGQGSRLGGLTRGIAKPAVSFGGKYRIIDFSLSNCANSHISNVGVLTQYEPLLLNSYIGTGSAWGLNSTYGGIQLLPSFVGEQGCSLYKGTANAIYQNIDYISRYDPEFVLILSGDHIYNMNYSHMLEFHKEKNANVTISVIEVPWEDISGFGIMSTNEKAQITKFTEKPANSNSNLASMGIYIFNWPILKRALIEDESDRQSDNDFGKNVIPKLLEQKEKLFSYHFQGYWKDVGTIESYYTANMELLQLQPKFNIFDLQKKVFSNTNNLRHRYIGANAVVRNSVISNGCTIHGEVINSILAPGVYVGEKSRIENSVLLPNSRISNDCLVFNTVIGEKAKIKAYCSIGGNSLTLSSNITVVGNNKIITENKQIEEVKTCSRTSVA
ncbi:MAG: glucose-1-phosphate adenylyltransferase [Desulfosporosinus sp.]